MKIKRAKVPIIESQTLPEDKESEENDEIVDEDVKESEENNDDEDDQSMNSDNEDEDDNSDESMSSNDDDDELMQKGDKKLFVNKGKLLKKSEELKLDLEWRERLSMISEDQNESIDKLKLKDTLSDVTLNSDVKTKNQLFEQLFQNDFLLERYIQMITHKGLVKCIEKGKIESPNNLKRPDDYFAEMLKTDKHMEKTRKFLVEKTEELTKRDRIRQLRLAKKLAKEKAKEQQLDERNKKRNLQKKKEKKLELKDGKVDKRWKRNKNGNRMKHDGKFGFGGQKKRSKYNTKDSYADVNNEKKLSNNKRPVKTKRLGKSRRTKRNNH
ncbi:hypothetical protein SNEBB_010956 [Seison nebaliae]|nr:hypothetical protein SNEBB_010956 [Seison nebaliae]